MRSSNELAQLVRRLEGKGFGAYKDIQGIYRFAGFALSVDHVQGDPFAAPSRLSAIVPAQTAGFPVQLSSTRIRRIALADYLTRIFHSSIPQICRGRRGTGHSGRFSIEVGGQEVLERNSVVVQPGRLEVRFTVGLPAAGRRVLGEQAEEMLCGELPKLVHSALHYQHLDPEHLLMHVHTVEDQEALRDQLSPNGLVAFIGNGSILPRKSGVEDGPLTETLGGQAIPFQSPPELEVELFRPNGPPLSGMGVPEGITLIVGGGFHGKSTLLRALERGVYNHLPGDGREQVVTIQSAVKVRAEDGRYVENVNISPFINHLPHARDTADFSTQNASGSTSQAANIMEALEMGTRFLLIDEDTSATNFIIRDARMQSLVEKPDEPITPFLDRVKTLHQEAGISTMMIMGGSGDYFDVADRVIMLKQYRAIEVTEKAKQIAADCPTQRQSEEAPGFDLSTSRKPTPDCFDPSRGKKAIKIDSRGLHTIGFGNSTIDLSGVEQLVDPAQTRAIGWAILAFANRYAPEGLSLREGLWQLMENLDQQGLDFLTIHRTGDLARPRLFEIASAMNRMRSLRVKDNQTADCSPEGKQT